MKKLILLLSVIGILSACASYDSGYQQRYVYRDGSYYYPGGEGQGDYYTDDDPYRHSYYDPQGYFWGSGYYSSGYSGCRYYYGSQHCSPWRYRYSWYPDRYYSGSRIWLGWSSGRGYWSSPYYSGRYGYYGGFGGFASYPYGYYGGYRHPYGNSYPYGYHRPRPYPEQPSAGRVIPMPKPRPVFPPVGVNPGAQPPGQAPVSNGPRVDGEYRWPEQRRYRESIRSRDDFFNRAMPRSKPRPVFVEPSAGRSIDPGPAQGGEPMRESSFSGIRAMPKPQIIQMPQRQTMENRAEPVIRAGNKGPAVDEYEP